jgi:hypothetical protein
MSISNFSPHLSNSEMLRTTKSIAEMRTKKVAELRLQTLKFYFHNSATPCSLRPVPLLSTVVPFPQLRMFFKIDQKYF